MSTPRSIFLCAGLLCFANLILTGCGGSPLKTGGTKYGDGSVVGSNVMTTKRYDVHTFDGVKITHNFDVNLAQGTTPRVIITADDNIVSLLKPRIKDNILHMEFSQGFRTRKRIRIRIEAPELERIDHLGRGSLILDNLNLRYLALKVIGDGDVSGLGQIKKLWIEAGGNGEALLDDIVTEEVEILLTGKGRVTVMATKRLEATNIGRGEIIYSGNPPERQIDNSGKGIIRKK